MRNEFSSNDLRPEITLSKVCPSRATKNNTISLLYINMRSIARRLSLLESYLGTLQFKPGILVITETRIFENEIPFYNINNYIAFHSTARNEYGRFRGDGCAIYVRKSPHLEATVVANRSVGDSNIVVVRLSRLGMHIAAANRPEQTSPELLRSEMEFLLEKFKRTLWVGDFNLNLLDNSDRQVQEYKELVSVQGYAFLNPIQTDYPTRVSKTIGTIIDHVFSDITDRKYEFSIFDCSLSDHKVICLNLPIQKPPIQRNHHTDRVVTDHLAIDNSRMWASLQSAESFDRIVGDLKQLITMHTSTVRKRRDRSCNSPWITFHILQLIKTREKLFRYKKRFPEHEHITEMYISTQKKVKYEINKSKKCYFDSSISNSLGNSRRLWGCIREIVFNREAQTHPMISAVSSPQQLVERCNDFNRFFVSVGSEVVHSFHFLQ